MPRCAKLCHFCGVRNDTVEIGHVDGHEENGAPDNLTWTCRSCNVIAGNTLRNAGLGRKTRQYNPIKKGGASNVGEWLQAVGAITPHVYSYRNETLSSEMPVATAVDIIRATPHAARSHFAAQLRRHMKGRRSAKNPLFGPGGVFGSRDYLYDLEEAREAAAERGRAKPVAKSRYRGYKLYRTPGGEFYSSLDPDSWYDSLAQVRRAIDGYKKGRNENPSKFDRCVKKVKAKGGAADPYAVCTAAGTRNRGKSRGGARLWPLRANVLAPLGIYDLASIQQAEEGIRKVALGGSGQRKKGKARKNPEDGAAELYQTFHGRPSTGFKTVEEQVHFHKYLAELGELERLEVIGLDGASVRLDNFGGSCLYSNEEGSQLYILGGDQSVDLGAFGIEGPIVRDFEKCGELREIRYYTTKDHLGQQGGEATYFHEFGEDDKAAGRRPRRPDLVYSVRDDRLLIYGGAYTVEPEGITN